MKKAFVYGTAVLALAAAPVFAQQSSSPQPSPTGAQGGSPTGGTGPRTGGQTGSQPQPRGGGSQTEQANQSGSASLSSADRQFVMEAAHGGMAEVELGRLAGDKAESAQVKQFAQRMVTDHTRANDELKTLAKNKNVTLPQELDAKHKATKERLEKLSGAAFDRAYMQEMVADHQKTVADFRKESQGGQDADIKAWATKSLPTLEQHYQMAQQASRGAVGTSGTASGSGREPANGGTRGTTGGQQPQGGGRNDDGAGGANTGGGTSPGNIGPGGSGGGSTGGGNRGGSTGGGNTGGGSTGGSTPR